MTGLDPAAYTLHRHPPTKDRSLRAFDAADQLVLAGLGDVVDARVLVVNDGFGALAVPLTAVGARVTVWTDSVLSAGAIERNLIANNCGGAAVVASTDGPEGPFDVVVLKVPKTLAFLEQQLVGIRELMTSATRLVGAGMVKHIHTSTLELFEAIVGPTVTSLATKKARLIHPELDHTRKPAGRALTHYTTDAGVTCVNHANVFSQRKLDIGTRLLLEHLGQVVDGADILDMGCGNGVVGTTLADRFDGGTVTFSDISYAATASAAATWEANRAGDERARFLTADVASGIDDDSLDLVVINPPFHDQHVVGTETAERMFVDARRVLRPGGEVRVIGNRHLGYHKRLRSLFGNLDTVASNPKFVVLSCQKRARQR